jgi:uncharacterized membrane protein
MVTTSPSRWGRGPLVTAGVTLSCVLVAIVMVVIALVSEDWEWAAFAGLLLIGALASLVVLTIFLASDRFPRMVIARLDALEEGLEGIRRGAVAQQEAPAAPPEVVAEPATGFDIVEPPGAPPPIPETVAPPPSVHQELPPPQSQPATEVALPTRPATTSAATKRLPAPSLEELLGGRALGIAGAVILVVAAGLFLKFGWDQGWFRPAPAARVALGVVAGFGLLGLGEWARRREGYRILSQILSAGGLGVVYVAAWSAYGLFHLVPATTAFALVAATAALGVAVSVATDGRAVASLATVGGFLAPLIVKLPDLSPLGLYAFVLVLDAAVLVVAFGRRWPELGPFALAGTAVHTVIAMSWHWMVDSQRLWDAGYLFAAVGLFFGVTLGFSWRRRAEPTGLELGVLAVASLGGWGVGLWRLDPLGRTVGGTWTVVLLLLEVVAAGVVMRRLGRDAAGRGLFLGLAFVFLTLLPPVIFDNGWLAATWALEAAVVGILASRPELWPARTGAAIVAVAAAIAALVATSGPDPGPPTFVGSEALLRLTAALLLGGLLIVTERRADRGWGPLSLVAAPVAAISCLAWIAPEISRLLEVDTVRGSTGGIAAALVGGVAALLGVALLAGWRRPSRPATLATGGILVLGVLVWDTPTSGLEGWRAVAAVAPLAWTALAAAAVAWRRDPTASKIDTWTIGIAAAATTVAAIIGRMAAAWPGDDLFQSGVAPAAVGAVAAALVLSAALRCHPGRLSGWIESGGWIVAVAAASRLLATAIAIGADDPSIGRRSAIVALSVLWGGAGLALVLAGLTARRAARRFTGLALLAMTAVKVFLVDLAAAPTIIRIVAFLVTGLALVGGSYLYARFRDRLAEVAE